MVIFGFACYNGKKISPKYYWWFEKSNKKIVIDKNISILYDGSDNKEKELESLQKEKED